MTFASYREIWECQCRKFRWRGRKVPARVPEFLQYQRSDLQTSPRNPPETSHNLCLYAWKPPLHIRHKNTTKGTWSVPVCLHIPRWLCDWTVRWADWVSPTRNTRTPAWSPLVSAHWRAPPLNCRSPLCRACRRNHRLKTDRSRLCNFDLR